MYCGEQGRGGGDNVEAFRFPPGDAPLAVRDCSRRVFCAGMLTGALASVMSLGGCAARRNEAEGSAVPAKQKANHPSAQKTDAVSRASWIAGLQQDIEALVEPYGDSVSVYAVALDPQTFASLDGEVAVAPDARRVAASIIKLPILACALETVTAGELSLDEQITVTQQDIVGGSGSIQSRGAGVSYSIDELLHAMIAQSDNVAANLVIGRLGMDTVNETCAALGLTQTVLARLMMDAEAQAQGRENYTSARDAAVVLQRLAAGTIATPELCERARGYLLAQEDARGIVEGVSGGVLVAHKTGSLANAQHDAAIVYAERPLRAGNPHPRSRPRTGLRPRARYLLCHLRPRSLLTCGEIGIVFAVRRRIQSLFHRNLEGRQLGTSLFCRHFGNVPNCHLAPAPGVSWLG